MIEIIHQQVPGRIRYRISGLAGAPRLRRFLEQNLSAHREITAARASDITGTLLVHHNSGSRPPQIKKLLRTALEHYARNGGQPPQPVATEHLTATAKGAVPRQSLPQGAPFPGHLLDIDPLAQSLETDPNMGLLPAEARRRLGRFGLNQLPQPEARSAWRLVLDQLNALPNYLLGAAAGVSILTGGLLDAAVVAGVVAANAAIGYLTERKAAETIDALQDLVRPTALVVRNGRSRSLPAEHVVPGDLLVLKPGVYIAADCRIINADHLSIDESMLTGESMPVFKSPDTLTGAHIPLADRRNMAFMGTLVTGGQGLALAVATGQQTQIGRLQLLLDSTHSPQTPIEGQLARISDQLVVLCGGICGVVFAIGLVRGYGLLQMLRISISLAAAAVPEGLPTAATVNFALGIHRMRRHNVLIRHLQALETLGAMETICLDKTGTLTVNRMTVVQLAAGGETIHVRQGRFERSGKPIDALQIPEVAELLKVAVLCNESRFNGTGIEGRPEFQGSATENALMDLALDGGVDIGALRRSHPLEQIIHRSETRLFMYTRHRTAQGDSLVCVKGSPAEVLALCDRQKAAGRIIPLEEADVRAVELENERMAGRALRNLGLAYRLDPAPGSSEFEGPADDPLQGQFVWLGLVGMVDPLRQGLTAWVERFHGAGINTVMITGDQSSTAFAIAEELHLSGESPLKILDSTQISALDLDTLTALGQGVHVFARVSPAHKLRIVQALQRGGRVVGMTGDGINDGPALKAADIGIAMGESGTDVARDVAEIVLKEDNLESLVIAVREGRGTYSNIRKSVRFFLTTNFSEIMVILASMGLGIGFPLNVMQLLWINLISDIFPGLALSMEPPEGDVLRQPPRASRAPLFSGRDYQRMTFEAATISAGALGAYLYGLRRYGAGIQAGTLAFQSLTTGQLLHALACRSETRKERLGSAEGTLAAPNPYLAAAVGGSLALQLLTAVWPPLRKFLGLAPFNLADSAIAGGAALIPLVINQTSKPAAQ